MRIQIVIIVLKLQKKAMKIGLLQSLARITKVALQKSIRKLILAIIVQMQKGFLQ